MTEKVDRSKRAVAYYRTTVMEGDESIESQREQVREWAEKHGLEIVREFEDRGDPGMNTELPPGFEALMRRVKRDRSFQFVLCAEVSRRDPGDDIDLPEWYSNECLKAGKAVIYTKMSDCENPDPIRPIFTHYMRLQYNDCCLPGQRVRRGLRHAAEQGYWTGGRTPYGMQRLLLDEKGKSLGLLESGERKIVHNHRVALVAGAPSEVAAIRRIFHQFVNLGYSTGRIARGLNAKRIPPPSGGAWKTRQVLACLRNKAYVGPIAYRHKKTRWTSLGGESDQWFHTPKARQSIVRLEQFLRAQEMLGEETTT